MKQANTVPKSVMITIPQNDFLSDEKHFSLSKFVQARLDDYIVSLKRYRSENEKKIDC